MSMFQGHGPGGLRPRRDLTPFQTGVASGEFNLRTTEDDERSIAPQLNGVQGGMWRARYGILTDPGTIAVVRRHGILASEFAELNLYHRNGFFESKITFQQSNLPLCPKICSPWFGRAAGAHILRHLAEVEEASPGRIGAAPKFLGLGAGRGTLDYDLMQFLTSRLTEGLAPEELREVIAEHASFVVSDRSQRGVGYLNENFQRMNIRGKLQGRISVQDLDACQFELPRAPFGVIYANEILDNMPIEPIVRIDGEDYVVYYAPRIADTSGLGRELSSALSAKFPKSSPEIINREDFLRLIDVPKVQPMNFNPVLVPLDEHPELAARVRASNAFQAQVEESCCAGIYPFSLKIENMLGSMKRSFDHGLIVLIDYFLREPDFGFHAWNVAVNLADIRNFGTQDYDFKVDPGQLQEVGRPLGVTLRERCTQREMLERAMGLNFESRPFDDTERQTVVARWWEANSEFNHAKKLSPKERADHVFLNFGHVFGMSAGWDVLTLEF